MRKTKIVCTIGPSSEKEEVFEQLCLAGLNVARLNFSHGSHEEHQKKIDMIKRVREKLKLPIAIMLDTKGPEFRLGLFENGGVEKKEGDKFIFTTDKITGNEQRVSVSYENLSKELEVGDVILVNNGLSKFRVTNINGNDIETVTEVGGVISNRKSLAFPDKMLKQVYLSEQDKADILFGIKNGVDFIACSFVSCKQDLVEVKDFINSSGGADLEIIAKIENNFGIDNIEEICSECSGIMIGRGDMGVDIPFEKLPAVQKLLITKCRLLGKRVITATEMLESMITNARPTRAEISDVANAVYDGTSAVMLSGETAMGKYPVLTVQTMSKICEETEKNIHYDKRFRSYQFTIKNTLDAISHATCQMAIDIHAKAVVVCSLSGMTARMVSRFRSPTDIIGVTVSEKVWRRLALSWGVTPVLTEEYPSVEVLFYHAKELAKKYFKLKKNDLFVITGGQMNKSGNTNLIKIETV